MTLSSIEKVRLGYSEVTSGNDNSLTLQGSLYACRLEWAFDEVIVPLSDPQQEKHVT